MGDMAVSRTVFPGVSDDPVTRVAVSAASSGDNTLVAAATARKIRVLAMHLSAASAVTVRVEDGAGGSALFGRANLVANGNLQVTLPYNPAGWFETTAATLLNLELGGAVQVSGCLVYQLVSS